MDLKPSKLVVTLHLLIISSLATGNNFRSEFSSIRNKDNLNISQSLINILAQKLEPALKSGYTIAQLNNYTDQILKNVEQYIIKLGLDPMNLPDEKLDLFPGSITLTKGYLEDASTIHRYDDVFVKYSTDTKIVELTLPLTFSELLLNYHYRTQVLLLSIQGEMIGKIEKVKINLHLGFNFNTYQAFVDKADVKDTGSIHINFEGHALTDWIVNLMSGVITTLFHGLILNIVDWIIQNPVEQIVDSINTAINHTLHPINYTVNF